MENSDGIDTIPEDTRRNVLFVTNEDVDNNVSNFPTCKRAVFNCKAKEDFIVKLITLLFLRSSKYQEFFIGCNVDGGEIFGDIVFKYVDHDGNFKISLVHVDFPQIDSIAFKAIDSDDKLNLLSCLKQINKVRENCESCKSLQNLGNFAGYEFIFYTCASIANSDTLKHSNNCLHSVLSTGNSEKVIYSICSEGCESIKYLDELQMYTEFLEDMISIQNPSEINDKSTLFGKLITAMEIKERLKTLEENPTQEILHELYSEVKVGWNVTSHCDVLSKFKLFTEQANVEPLSGLIRNEILQVEKISEFGVLIMYKYLLQEIEKCLKCSNYLSNKSDIWKTFLLKLKHCRKMPESYKENMSTINIKYFACSTKSIIESIFKFRVLNIVACIHDIFLSCLKLYQILEEVAPCKYLWIPFSTLVSWTEDVLQLWFSDSFPILVIECKSDHENFKNIPNEIVQILRMHKKKYVIVVSAGKSNFISRLKNIMFPDDYCELKDDFKYGDLDDRSQKEILNCEVQFQGQLITIGSLIVPRFHDLTEGFGASILSQFMQRGKGSIVIGPPLNDSIGNYIPRTLELLVELDVNIIRTIISSEVFVISGTSLSELRKILLNEDIQPYSPESQKVNSECRLFFSTSKNFEFSTFCKHFSLKNVHHFIFKNGSLWWRESKGHIKYLKDFLKEIENAKHIFEIMERSGGSICNPATLLDSTHHHTVILGDSGIGKSTLLCELQKKTKTEYPLHWLIHLNFVNDIKLIVNTSKEDYDCEIIIQIMYSLLKNEHHALEMERILLRHEFENRGNIIVICEGLESVKSIYINKVLDFIHALSAMNVKKIWFVTTYDLKSTLEKSFRTGVFEIQPLTSNEQVSLLQDLWKEKCRGSHQSELKEFVMIVQHVYSSCKTSLLSLPLICLMTAEIFETQLIEYLSTSSVNWPENIDIAHVFDRFIHQRRLQFIKNNDIQIASEIHEEQEEFFLTRHMLCALFSLLDFSELSQLNLIDIFENVSYLVEETKRFGIIQSIVNKKPVFLHKTVAEYFAAMWFAKNTEKSRDFLKQNMFAFNFRRTLKFVDYFLIKGHQLHTAVLKNDNRGVKTLLEYGVDRNSTDKAGRTALHLSIVYSPPIISTFPREGLEEDRYDPCTKMLIDYSVNTKMTDNVLLWRPVQYAIELKKWDAMDLLFKDQIDFNDIDCFKEKLEDVSFVQEGLRIGSEKGYFHLIECFSCCGVNITDNMIQTNEGMYSPLHIAAKYGQLKLVRFLLSKKVKISIRDDKGISPVHLAASEGMIEVVMYLLQRGADLHCTDKDGNTPLNFAIFKSRLQMTVLLVDQYHANINIQNKFGDSALHHAMKFGHITIIEFLLMKGVDSEICNQDGNTALHLAVWIGMLPAVQLLLEYEANVNACNKQGDTPLSRNAGGGNLEVVKILVNKGADVNKRSDDGNTALHWAARQNNLNVVEYLLSKGANINAQNKYGNTPLHRAVEHGGLTTTKFLINAGCNIQLKNSAGFTPVKMRSRSKEVIDCIACL